MLSSTPLLRLPVLQLCHRHVSHTHRNTDREIKEPKTLHVQLGTKEGKLETGVPDTLCKSCSQEIFLGRSQRHQPVPAAAPGAGPANAIPSSSWHGAPRAPLPAALRSRCLPNLWEEGNKFIYLFIHSFLPFTETSSVTYSNKDDSRVVPCFLNFRITDLV